MDLVFAESGAFVLRMTFGVLTLAHGLQKWGNIEKLMGAWQLSRPVATAVMYFQISGDI